MTEVAALPKISVCIPTYNSSAFIAQAIESVLDQDFRDFELIVIDNNSSDHTVKIVNRYCDIDPRIHCEVNGVNIGMVGNFNKCLERSRGKYVKFLCSDDFLTTPTSLKIFFNEIEKDPNISLVVSARRIVDSESNTIKLVSNYRDGLCCNGVDIINDCLFSAKNKLGEPTAVMFKKKQSSRGFDNMFKQILDLEMWFHLLEQGKFKFIERDLVAFRVHQDQATELNQKSLAGIDDFPLIIDRYARKDYIKYGFMSEFYLKLDHFRSVWRGVEKKRFSKQYAITKIRQTGNYTFFRLSLPFYPLLKRIFRGNY